MVVTYTSGARPSPKGAALANPDLSAIGLNPREKGVNPRINDHNHATAGPALPETGVLEGTDSGSVGCNRTGQHCDALGASQPKKDG